MQASHWQVVALHAWVPPIPQGRLAPAAHTPSFAHVPQADQTPLSQVRVAVPQFPQAIVAEPAQLCPPHASHWQVVALQVWVPPAPQAWVAPAMQAPWPVHIPQSDQTPLLHVRLLVPQFPQAIVAGPAQVWPPHAPQWQAPSQVCVPPVPHD
jgi:hypothetical protein